MVYSFIPEVGVSFPGSPRTVACASAPPPRSHSVSIEHLLVLSACLCARERRGGAEFQRAREVCPRAEWDCFMLLRVLNG